MANPTIVLIHGLFVSKHSWQPWVAHYQAKGYTVLTPAWPGRDQSVAELQQRANDPRLAQHDLRESIDFHAQFVQNLPEKPIVIGHSMGGLITQILANRQLIRAGVAIDSAPPQGVISTKWSFIKSALPMINPLRSASKPYSMPFEHFQYTFVNGMPLAEQQAIYQSQVVPESLKNLRQSLTSVSKVDFKADHAPLLLIAGEIDHIIPASLNYSNYRKYRHSLSLTDFKQFAGRNHYIVGQPNWQEVADYALDWVETKALVRQAVAQ
ncbi:alpha/beta hydrolase [Herpetosiphon llansteffanensis]